MIIKQKIPDSPLTDIEWKEMNEYFDSLEKPLSSKDRKDFYDYLDKLVSQEEDRETICLFCGKDMPLNKKRKNHKHRGGLCVTCKKAIDYRNVIRDASIHRGYNKTIEKKCIACGKEGIYSKNLCRSCYHFAKKFNCDTVEEFVELYKQQKIEEQKKASGKYRYLVNKEEIY